VASVRRSVTSTCADGSGVQPGIGQPELAFLGGRGRPVRHTITRVSGPDRSRTGPFEKTVLIFCF
jgi:hypothetical protein